MTTKVEITERMIDKGLAARIPGGSAAEDWFLPHDNERAQQNIRCVVREICKAALAASEPAPADGLVEPVAWMHFDKPFKTKQWQSDTPLYAHPPAALQSTRAEVLEEAAKKWPKEYTESKDLKLLMANTDKHYANYPPYVNLTMIRMDGAVRLTVRLPPPDGKTEGKTGCVFFTRDMWNKFVDDLPAAQTIYSAADYLDSII